MLSFICSGVVGAGLQYPAYFKDAKGNNHSVFGSNSLGSLQYLKQGQKGMLPDVLQQGRNAGMPLYVRCPICQKEFKQKSTLLQHGCIHIESRYFWKFSYQSGPIILWTNPLFLFQALPMPRLWQEVSPTIASHSAFTCKWTENSIS